MVTLAAWDIRRSAILESGEERAVSGATPCWRGKASGGWVGKVADADVGYRLLELPL